MTEVFNIGDVMPSGHRRAGKIYGGLSEKTGQPFYIEPNDSEDRSWRFDTEFAAAQGARLPSRKEIKQIHAALNLGALRGTFNEKACYWAATGVRENNDYAWVLNFRTGDEEWEPKHEKAACLRLIWD